MFATTRSGSLYEIDEESKRVRRLHGVKNPTPRQGQDGEWHTYESMGTGLGGGALFVWSIDNTDDGAVARTTQTSTIVKTGNTLAEVVTVN